MCLKKNKNRHKVCFIFPIKNSLDGTKLETNLESLYEKIVDINNLKVFRLLEFFQSAA